ncbi:hypothetical protein HBB16_06880 [Pseudonocardia sp. MCCB 268]|nr:hypothetical protein [Pseudonocardia cytotoxica]
MTTLEKRQHRGSGRGAARHLPKLPGELPTGARRRSWRTCSSSDKRYDMAKVGR